MGDHRVAQIFSLSRVLPHQNRTPLALSPWPDRPPDPPLGYLADYNPDYIPDHRPDPRTTAPLQQGSPFL